MPSSRADRLRKAFGVALRRRREAAGMSQQGLALAAGLNAKFVWLLEVGQRTPTIVTVDALARALGCRADELVQEAVHLAEQAP